MIPQTPDYLNSDTPTSKYSVLPTLTYNYDENAGKFVGRIKEKDSVVQFISKTLATDKYAYEIYDWYYGNELIKLVGKSSAYAITEIPRIVKEALTADDRITDVVNFTFEQTNVDSITASCLVKTVYGDISHKIEVKI